MGAVSELWSFRGLIANLAQRELRAKYKKSVFGWAWSLLNPLATLLVYTLVFGVLLKIQPPIAGNGHTKSFGLYLFAALVMWNFFNAVIIGSMGALAGAGPLLRKVYFPPECAVLANVWATLYQTAAEIVILALAMVVVVNVSWTFLLAPFLVILLMLFATGLGLAVSMGNVYYRDVSYLVGIVLNLLFYATPIIYPLSLVPDEVHGVPARAIVELNPLTQFVQVSRDLFYELNASDLWRWGYLIVVSFATLAVGWWLFQRRAALVSEEV
jgi:ABC-type polysaccharide/polyol phosphate export permease